MQYFYSSNIINDLAILNEEESKHCIKVLRHKLNDKIHLIDGLGGLFLCKILDDNFNQCKLQIIKNEDVVQRNFKLHIAISPIKNVDRFEWFIEKATEIGIDEITPIVCNKTEKLKIKKERIQRILLSATKQSLNATIPKFNEMINFKDFINIHKNNQNFEKFIAYCGTEITNNLKSLYSKNSNTVIIIGPEGDFTDNEVAYSFENGFNAVSLGINRLRTETAGVIACSTINILNI
ncbi:MAG: 16S rRNA (uracil(1498)-N(3))-methyltransferase [Bacteroidetes bacterium GWA2_31_9]|nr:MAG: 16S rRNA (uracil(1498)-N(3))-methyltransferase [Bacteroidetes bacterium GWA2_31_9]